MLCAPFKTDETEHGHAVQLGYAVESAAVQTGGFGFGAGSAGGATLGA